MKARGLTLPFCALQPADINLNGFVVLPYVQGVSEIIGREQQQVGVSYRPQRLSTACFHVLKSEMILTVKNQAYYTKSVARIVVLYTTAKQKDR